MSQLKLLFNIRVGVCVGCGVIVVFLRSIGRRTLYDPYFPYFSPEVMVKLWGRVRGHFMMFIEVSMDLFECNPGHTSVD